MFSVQFDSKQFVRDITNAIDYSVGFMDGVEIGKNLFLKNFGIRLVEIMNSYIDSNARVDPAMLQHMYEWEKSGSPDARLFDLRYNVGSTGLSVNATFRQSSSIQSGSKEPFYDKARIMEKGIPITIRPTKSDVLVFKDGEETVFTKNPVYINNPGGIMAEGGFERTFRSFFENYFSQAFMQSSGLQKYLETPSDFAKNFSKSKTGGKALGRSVGFKWITKAGAE